jgi:hypothetical protein
MTIERKLIVGLEDIRAICFECASCRARLMLRPGDVKEIPRQCPHCPNAWNNNSGIVMEKKKTTAFEDLVLSLETISTLMQNREPGKGFRILFEFEEPNL